MNRSKQQRAAAAAAAAAVAVEALPAQANPPALLFRTVGKLAAMLRKNHADCPSPIGWRCGALR